MTLAISISSEAEKRLAEKARAAGIDLPTLASQMLEAEAKRLEATAKPGHATIELLEKWDEEDATEDPVELARRQAEGEKLMKDLAKSRVDSEGVNARKLWP